MRALIVLLLGLGLTGCQEEATPVSRIRPAQVWTVTAESAGNRVNYSGEVRARYSADLAFRVAGKVVARHVETGERVAAGQLLVALDGGDFELGVAGAQAALSAAEADLLLARDELQRLTELREKQFVDQSTLDRARAAHDAAQARLTSARSQVTLSTHQLDYSRLTADYAGIITGVSVETGQVVSAGMPVLHIVYGDEREVHVHVGEERARRLRPATPAAITLWSDPRLQLQGRVREVAPAADASRSFLVKVELLDPPARLPLGVTADVSLADPLAVEHSRLPASALFQQGERPAVWQLGADHRVSIHPVEVIAYRAEGVLVAPLPEGMQVIAAGVHQLREGERVEPIPYDGKAGS